MASPVASTVSSMRLDISQPLQKPERESAVIHPGDEPPFLSRRRAEGWNLRSKSRGGILPWHEQKAEEAAKGRAHRKRAPS
jgi:hypothetical protein